MAISVSATQYGFVSIEMVGSNAYIRNNTSVKIIVTFRDVNDEDIAMYSNIGNVEKPVSNNNLNNTRTIEISHRSTPKPYSSSICVGATDATYNVIIPNTSYVKCAT